VLTELLSIVAPIYIAIGAGFVWARAGQPWHTEFVTHLIMTIGAPCLVFSSLVSLTVESSALLQMTVASVAAFAVTGLVGAVLLRIFKLPRTSFLAPVMFPNAGNMGLPVCLFAFGDEGLALGICFYTVATFLQFSVGVSIWRGSVSTSELMREPLFWSVLLAVVVMLTDVPVPAFAMRTTELLGGFTIPLMQLSLGVSLGSLKLGALPRTTGVAVLRLGLGLAVGTTLAELFGLEGVARGVLILDCSMPVAVLNYLLARRYERDPEDVASVVVISTLISLATLPLILVWLL
jgi:predicted permease